jgi:pimeloyl-ACP methyl ester carboxylesterase
MGHLGNNKAHFIAYSRGAAYAQQFALQNPNSVVLTMHCKRTVLSFNEKGWQLSHPFYNPYCQNSGQFVCQTSFCTSKGNPLIAQGGIFFKIKSRSLRSKR